MKSDDRRSGVYRDGSEPLAQSKEYLREFWQDNWASRPRFESGCKQLNAPDLGSDSARMTGFSRRLSGGPSD
jgi:hypothetical protein